MKPSCEVWQCCKFLGIVCDYEICDCALVSGALYQQESTGSRSILLQQVARRLHTIYIYTITPPKIKKKTETSHAYNYHQSTPL